MKQDGLDRFKVSFCILFPNWKPIGKNLCHMSDPGEPLITKHISVIWAKSPRARTTRKVKQEQTLSRSLDHESKVCPSIAAVLAKG